MLPFQNDGYVTPPPPPPPVAPPGAPRKPKRNENLIPANIAPIPLDLNNQMQNLDLGNRVFRPIQQYGQPGRNDK